MSQVNLDYSRPSLPNPGPLWSLRLTTGLFWCSIVFLLVTATVIVLPVFGSIGNRLPTVGRWAQFVMSYGKWIALALATTSIAWAYFTRSFGWLSRIQVSVAIALVVFYWLLAPHDGAYGRMLYGAC